MRTEVITPPVAQPVTEDTLKNHLRIDGDDENLTLKTVIEAATAQVETDARLSLVTRAMRTTIDRIAQTWPDFPPGISYGPEPYSYQQFIQLEARPLIAVTSIEFNTTPGSDTWTTWEPSEYRVENLTGQFARISPVKQWPQGLRDGNALRVDYTVGYGDNPNSIPNDIRLAITHLAAHLYNQRGDQAEAFPAIVTRLMAPHTYLEV